VYGRTARCTSRHRGRQWSAYGPRMAKSGSKLSGRPNHADPDKLIGIRGHPFGFPFAAISAPNTYIRGFFQRQKWRRWASVRECASVLVSRGSTVNGTTANTADNSGQQWTQWTDNGQDFGMVVRTPRRGRGRRKKQWDNTPIVVGSFSLLRRSAGQELVEELADSVK